MGLRAVLVQIAEDINKLNYFTLELESEGREPRLSEDVKLGFFRMSRKLSIISANTLRPVKLSSK
jgi:hypothetical protein